MKNPKKISSRLMTSNPVAKFAHQFNKAQVFADKKSYCRHAKHRKQEAPLIILLNLMSAASCFQCQFA